MENLVVKGTGTNYDLANENLETKIESLSAKSGLKLKEMPFIKQVDIYSSEGVTGVGENYKEAIFNVEKLLGKDFELKSVGISQIYKVSSEQLEKLNSQKTPTAYDFGNKNNISDLTPYGL